jgi:hypothetical protein
MKFQITSMFRVSPEIFWRDLFFDADYNAGLYQALGFPHCEVQRLDRAPDGTVHRRLRVVPLIKAPLIIRRKLEDRFFYIEEGTFEPSTRLWRFQTIPSMAPDHTKISGVIHTQPNDKGGMEHVLHLTADITAFGLGTLLERAVESNTRDSYRRTVEFTDAYAARKGLC